MKKTQCQFVFLLKFMDNEPFKVCLLAMILFLSPLAEARMFSFEKESVAPFVNFRSGLSSAGNQPYAWQSAGQYSGDDIDLIYGGEFGVYFRSGSFGLSLGLLVHKFDPVTGGKGASSSGDLYSVDVEGLSYGPVVLFDYQFAQEKNHMWKFVFGGGYQFSKIESSYSFSALGQSLVGGQSSLEETYRSDSPFAVVGVGTEFVMSGATTINIMFGYHYVLSKEWSYVGGGENFAGAFQDGGSVLFEDGMTKSVDMSYPFLQIGFQFYIDKVR